MPKVKIYSTPSCPWCKMTKEFFKEHNVEYEDIDVSGNPEAAKEMTEKSGQMGVPVIDIDGEIIIGFNKVVIEDILKKKK